MSIRAAAAWALAAALTATAASGTLAQTTAPDAGAATTIELSPAQKQTVYQSISHTEKNHAAPIGFRVSIGAHVPAAVDLAPLPDTLAELIPQAKGFDVAMIERHVVLVDPRTRQIVLVLTQDSR